MLSELKIPKEEKSQKIKEVVELTEIGEPIESSIPMI